MVVSLLRHWVVFPFELYRTTKLMKGQREWRMVEGSERNQVKVEHKVWRKCSWWRSDLFQNAHLPEEPSSPFTILTCMCGQSMSWWSSWVKLKDKGSQSTPSFMSSFCWLLLLHYGQICSHWTSPHVRSCKFPQVIDESLTSFFYWVLALLLQTSPG